MICTASVNELTCFFTFWFVFCYRSPSQLRIRIGRESSVSPTVGSSRKNWGSVFPWVWPCARFTGTPQQQAWWDNVGAGISRSGQLASEATAVEPWSHKEFPKSRQWRTLGRWVWVNLRNCIQNNWIYIWNNTTSDPLKEKKKRQFLVE
jgi:hypothetical protein